jgi:hypothetical protein
MRLNTYNQLLSELARRHKAIAYTPENGRFMRIFISADPVQKQLDLLEFYRSLRSKLKAKEGQPFLIAQNYQVDYGDNNGDYLSRELSGAYLVLQRVKVDDYDARDGAVANCEKIAEQVFALLVHQLREEHDAYLTEGDAWLEHIGPLEDSSLGVRLNFSFRDGAAEELTYNEDLFID